MLKHAVFPSVQIYLSGSTLTANNQRLVHRLQLTLNIPVSLLRHIKDMRFELLLAKTQNIQKDPDC